MKEYSRDVIIRQWSMERSGYENVDVHIELEVDIDAIMVALASKAINNKNGRATAMHRMIKAYARRK